MQSALEDVAIFWDYENCHASAQTSGYEVAAGIRNAAHRFGTVKHFKAYMETPDSDTARSLSLRSELQSSGVSLTDCPHNGRKNVADQMIMVDMLAYALDHGPPATLILISGDRDFAYAVAVLRLRRYQVVVISLPMPGAHISLKSQASVCLDWNVDVMGYSHSPSSVAESSTAVRSPPGSVQSPIARRASLLSGPESQYFKVGQPTIKSVASPSTLAPNIPSESASTPVRTVPSKEPVAEHPPVEPEEAEVTCAPAPAYSPTFDTIPTAPSLGFGSVTTTPLASSIIPTRSQSSAGQSWLRPVSSPPALFSEDHVTAHIQRCMDLETEDEVQPSTSRISSPRAALDIQAALALPLLASPTTETNDPISAEAPLPPKAVPPKVVPPAFEILVEILEKHRAKGIPRPLRSTISFEIVGRDRKVYKNAGVEKWAQYAALASKAKIIELGGIQGEAWVSLHSDWCTPKCNKAEGSGQVPVASPIALFSDESISVHIQRCTENTASGGFSGKPTVLPVKSDTPPASGSSGSSPLNAADGTPSQQTLLAAFNPLVDILEKYKAQGAERPLRSAVGYELFALAKMVYKEAGTTNFSQLTALAEKANIVKLGGSDGRAWISLHPNWNSRK